MLRWAWVIPLFTMVANALTIHIGQTTLFRLPARLPLVGGVVTAEAAIGGLLSGYALLVLLAIFATFNAASDYYAMLRLVPSFLFQAGLVASIALTFVPQTMQALDEIREAQQIRGQRFRGMRDLPPLFLPLLTMGLERSIQLAEAMESRGFGGIERGHGRAGSRTARHKAVMLGGLLLLVGGMALLLFSTQQVPGLALLSGGGIVVGLALRGMGRRVRRSRFRAPAWHRRDTVLAVAALALLLALGVLSNFEQNPFLFYPYPRLVAPPFEPAIGIGLLLLVLPVVLVPSGEQRP